MSEILVIGDIHQKLNTLKDYLKDWDGDVVFTGDYFDDFDDNIFEVAAMAEWLAENLDNPKYTFLCGNHDFQYMVIEMFVYCSGFASWKYSEINKILTKEHWNKLKFFHNIGDIWFSHAGITRHWFDHPVNGLTVENINEVIDKAKAHLNIDSRYLGALWAADRYRGGRSVKGGLLWNDWHNSEFIPNVMQIVGHTPHPTVQYIKNDELNASLLNIDTHLNSIIKLNTATKDYTVIDKL